MDVGTTYYILVIHTGTSRALLNTNYSARNKENLKNKAHWCVWNRPDSIKDMTSSAALHQNFTHFMVEIEEAKLAIFDTRLYL